jgi:hypothetical protein
MGLMGHLRDATVEQLPEHGMFDIAQLTKCYVGEIKLIKLIRDFLEPTSCVLSRHLIDLLASRSSPKVRAIVA